MVKPKKKQKKQKNNWKPRYCIACHNVIKPSEKEVSITTARRAVFYFHFEHYTELLGKPRGGRPNMIKIDLLVSDVDRKRREYLVKQMWNEQEFEKFNGMKRILAEVPKANVTTLKKADDPYLTSKSDYFSPEYGKAVVNWLNPTNKPPKAHVIDEFEPKEYTKEEHMEMIIELLQDGKARTSKQIEKELPINRSTITWRLWDHCENNDKSDLEEIFYIAKRIKGEQHYSLIDLRIKEVKPEDKQALGTVRITVKYCKLCGGLMTSVAPNSQVLMCPDGHTEVIK